MPLYNQIAGVDDSSLNGAAVGLSFGDVFKGIQHFAAGMGMQVPRTAFLALVRINAFGYANKLYRAIQYPDINAKLNDLWERVGGKYSALVSEINHGNTQPIVKNIQETPTSPSIPVTTLAAGTYRDTYGDLRYSSNNQLVPVAMAGGKIGEVAAAAGIIASAAIIVAAIMPVIMKLLAAKNVDVPTGIQYDPNTGLPLGVADTSNPVVRFIQQNPLPVAAIALALGYYVYKNY